MFLISGTRSSEQEVKRVPSCSLHLSALDGLQYFMTESVAIVTLNILTIIVFIKNCSLRKRSMYLVINLEVADMLVGGCAEAVHFMWLGESCFFWRITHSQALPFAVHLFIMQSLPGASLTNIAAISLERAHATFRPFRHRFIKKWVFGLIISIIWVTSGLLLVPIFLPRSLLTKLGSFFYFWSSFTGFCFFVIFVSYGSIVVKFSCGAHPQHHGAASRERELTKTLLIVTLVALLMWLPFTISWPLLAYLLNLSFLGSFHLLNALMVLFFANSLVNPILYVIRMPDFKRALASLFRRQKRQVGIIPLGPL